jgi:hypothetical protein
MNLINELSIYFFAFAVRYRAFTGGQSANVSHKSKEVSSKNHAHKAQKSADWRFRISI